MNISEYFNVLKTKSNSIFERVIQRESDLASVHDLATKLFNMSRCFPDVGERDMVAVLCSQLESSCLSLAFGFYRQALSSLRLSFELGLGVVYFSVNKMECKEWQQGAGDIKWSKIIDEDNGVLSKRFAKAFNPCLQDTVFEYRSRAIVVYRILSEYVHGNSETWKESGMVLERNERLEDKYFQCFSEVSDVLLYSIFCRYAREFDRLQVDDFGDVFDGLSYVSAIREFFGGPKDIS